jgi:hypothetical protein
MRDSVPQTGCSGHFQGRGLINQPARASETNASRCEVGTPSPLAATR